MGGGQLTTAQRGVQGAAVQRVRSGGVGWERGLIARRNVPSRVNPLPGSERGCIGSATSFVGSKGGMGTIPLRTRPRPVPAKSTPPGSSVWPACAVASGSTTIMRSSPAGRVRGWPLASWSYQRGLRATERTWRPPALMRSIVQGPPATLLVWTETTPSPAPSATYTCPSSPGTTASFVGTAEPHAGDPHRPIARLDARGEHPDGSGHELAVLA